MREERCHQSLLFQRAYSRGSGGPLIYPYNLSFFTRLLGGVPHQGGLPGQPARVIRFGGASFLCVKAAECGNPSNRGSQTTATKPPKTHGRTIWLLISTSVSSHFHDFTSKTTKTLMKLTELATNLSMEWDSQTYQRN